MSALVAMNAINPIATEPQFLSRAVTQRSDSRQLFSLEKFKRGAAARRDERHLVGEPGLFHRRDRIASADDRRRSRAREDFRDCNGSRGEGWNFQDADRPVPQD